MGLFDEVVFNDECPYCKTWQTFIVQTKAYTDRGLSQYKYWGDPKDSLMGKRKNDCIPLKGWDKELSDAEHVDKGYITGITSCKTPFCLWYGMRAEIMQDPEHPCPRSLGRWLDVKMPFNKKSGELQKPIFILSPQLPEEVLQKALKTLFLYDKEGVKKAAKEANYEPLLILLQYERNKQEDMTWHYKPKSEQHTTKKKASTSQRTTSKASRRHYKKSSHTKT